MSDLAPFETGGDDFPVLTDQTSDTGAFTAPLEGFDWEAYESRRTLLDPLLLANDPDALTRALHRLQAEHPEVGVKLNNLHNTRLQGELPGFVAPLAVMSRSIVKASMPGLDFYAGVATQTDFTGSNLRGANLVDTVLTGSNFTGTDLRGAEFNNATLMGADFTGADLAGADFSNAYMFGVKGLDDPEALKLVNLSGARTVVLEGREEGSIEKYLASRFGNPSDLDTAKRMLDPVPVATDQVVPRLTTKRQLRGLVGVNLVANDVDFSGSFLIGANLENFSANGVQLRGVTMSGAIIREALMRDGDLFGLWAPGLVLEEVDLRNSRLHNANLVGSVLRGVDLRGVTGLDQKDTNVEGIVIEDCKLPQGYGYNGIAIEASDKKQRELES